MDRQSNNHRHRDEGRTRHDHYDDVDRGRQRDHNEGGGRYGSGGSGNSGGQGRGQDNEPGSGGGNERHPYQYQQQHHQQQQQQQQQQHCRHDRQRSQQGGRRDQGHASASKRSRSPSLPHHNDSKQHHYHQQQQQHRYNNIESPRNNNYQSKSSHHHGNQYMPHEEWIGDPTGGPPNAPPPQPPTPPQHQPHNMNHLLSPSTTSNQHNPPSLNNVVVPPEKRRTLILSHIPSHIQFYHLQTFFRRNWNAPIQYCVLDRKACDAYVVFKFVHDAQRVWVEGRQQKTRRNGEEYGTDDNIGGALDGNGGVVNNGKPVENSDSNNCTTSLVALGVELRAVHTSNHVVLDSESFREGGDSYYNSQGGYIDDNYRYEGGDEVDANGVQSGRVGGSINRRSQNNTMCRSVSDGHSYHHGHSTSQDGCAPPSKLPRYSDDRYAMDSQQHHETSHVSPASASIQSSTPNNNNTYYPRATAQSTYQKPDQQEIQLSSIELQLQQQEEAEEWAKWEAFQLEEKEWRKRRHVEYNTFIQAKNERSTQISTLEQKRELLSKQEHMLSQQLPLHKKMLVMLKSKNATPSEQSTKMKEILSTSKRIVELKTELKGVIEDIEKMKEVESNHGVFRPSEKRPVFSGNMVDPNARVVPGKKRSLDRRTTMLKVRGFDDAGNANEDSIMKQFSAYGAVTSVSLEKRAAADATSNGGGGDEDASSLVAVINYENRIDAERAKSEIAKLNGLLTCTWHKPSASAGSAFKNDGQSPDGKDHELGTDDCDDDQGLYDDYDDGEDNEDPYYDDENAEGDYDGEEDFVDYD